MDLASDCSCTCLPFVTRYPGRDYIVRINLMEWNADVLSDLHKTGLFQKDLDSERIGGAAFQEKVVWGATMDCQLSPIEVFETLHISTLTHLDLKAPLKEDL